MPSNDQNYGIKVSQVGTDVFRAADYQLVFNSDWPSLQVAFDTTVTIGPAAQLTIPHNLKMYPFVMAWVLQNGVNLGRALGLSEIFESTPQATTQISWDNTNVYLNNTDTNTYQVNVKCYNLDISQQIDYTNPQPAVVPVKYDPIYGIKVVKYGKSIASSDLRDFILNSQAQSPAVLAVVTKFTPLTGFAGSIQYQNPVNYIPWVYAFAGVITNGVTLYTPVPTGPQQTGYLFQLGITSYLINSSGLDSTHVGSIVVLRDPLTIQTTKAVTYNG